MSDVRSMLQSERSSRKIKHPHAAYTSTGQLMCSVCRCPIKSATLWENHLRSESHLTVVKKTRVSRSSHAEQDVSVPSRKRKAEADDDQENKRVRSGPVDREDGNDRIDNQIQDEPLETPAARTDVLVGVAERRTLAEVNSSKDRPPAAPTDAINEDEWAAFERDMAVPDESEPKKFAPASLLRAAPTISAAPMSAEQLAAQAREEQSVQNGAREAELEEEREDASRQMDEEMGRMEQLDDRMLEWRARKEALRGRGRADSATAAAPTSEPPDAQGPSHASVADKGEDDASDEEDDEDPAWRGLGGV